jgi:hypothetical protein
MESMKRSILTTGDAEVFQVYAVESDDRHPEPAKAKPSAAKDLKVRSSVALEILRRLRGSG